MAIKLICYHEVTWSNTLFSLLITCIQKCSTDSYFCDCSCSFLKKFFKKFEKDVASMELLQAWTYPYPRKEFKCLEFESSASVKLSSLEHQYDIYILLSVEVLNNRNENMLLLMSLLLCSVEFTYVQWFTVTILWFAFQPHTSLVRKVLHV